jgi:hypothetical protein
MRSRNDDPPNSFAGEGGESGYFNSSWDEPSIYRRVRVRAFQGSLANKPRRAANFPLAVPPGQSDTLDVLFEVNGGVKKAFRVPAELRVYYTSSGKEETARATLVGEPLNAQAP